MPSVPPPKIPPWSPPKKLGVDEVNVQVNDLLAKLYGHDRGMDLPESEIQKALRTLSEAATSASAALEIDLAEAELRNRKRLLRESADRVKLAEEKLASLKAAK